MRNQAKYLLWSVMTFALVAPAFAGGNANFVLGSRRLNNKDFWEPTEDQGVLQATVDFGKQGWPIHLAVGVGASVGEKENVFDPITSTFDKLTGTVSELSVGVMKVWEPKGNTRPFIAGGISSVTAKLEVDNPVLGKISEDDTSIGYYVQGGVFWRIGTRFNIGFEGRLLTGTDITIGTVKGDADYGQFGLLLGWGWPPRK